MAFDKGLGPPPGGTGIGSKLQFSHGGKLFDRQVSYWRRNSTSGLGPPFGSMIEINNQGKSGSFEEGSEPMLVEKAGCPACETAMKAA